MILIFVKQNTWNMFEHERILKWLLKMHVSDEGIEVKESGRQ